MGGYTRAPLNLSSLSAHIQVIVIYSPLKLGGVGEWGFR